MFIEVMTFSFLGNACLLIWFYDEDFLHHFCGYSVFYWKGSAFPTYCCLDHVNSIKYMTYALEWLTLWKILCAFWVSWLLKINVVVTWLQHRVLLFPKHWQHLPDFKVLLLFSLQCCFWFCYCQWVETCNWFRFEKHISGIY